MVSPKLGCAAGRNSNNTFGHAFVRCNAYPGPSACSFLPQTLSMRRLNSNLCIPTYDHLNNCETSNYQSFFPSATHREPLNGDGNLPVCAPFHTRRLPAQNWNTSVRQSEEH